MVKKKNKIAVLGAGPMGLAVAYQLALDGYRPIVYEAGKSIGGMSATFDFDGMHIERFYHFHCVSDQDLFEILDELGLKDKMLWRETKMGFFWRGRVNPWGNPIALVKFPGLSLIAKIRYGLHAYFAVKRSKWESLDRLKATDWIKAWVGEEAFTILWQKLFTYKFYHMAEDVSAAWIWSRIKRVGTSRYDLFREKLGYLEGGSATLLGALNEKICSSGGQILLNTPVEKICIENSKIVGVQTRQGLQCYDTVISTIPLPFIPKIAPDLPKAALKMYESQKNIAVVCVVVKLRAPLSDFFWLNVNDDEMDIPGLVEYTNLRSLDNAVVYVPFYMPYENPNYSLVDEDYKSKTIRYLMKINPSLTKKDFLSIEVSRYRYSQPVCGPNFLSGLPDKKTAVKGLWVADTSFYYPHDRGISESVGFGRKMAKEAANDF